MVSNIAKKALLTSPILVHNRTISRAEEFVKSLPPGRAVVCSDLSDGVQKADIIFSCLGDDKAILETYESKMIPYATKGKLFVDCSTVAPETATTLQQKLAEKGASYCAMPVFGAPIMADAGQLVPVFAGDKEDLEKLKPYLEGV
jgi:3-hydroxyisobutyrate dehydrogenase-like beta-hydroxyacid dehydrogenase